MGNVASEHGVHCAFKTLRSGQPRGLPLRKMLTLSHRVKPAINLLRTTGILEFMTI